ncbi:MAG TPA: hypothetical protein VFM57_00830 [Thermoleophilaceae bacterium]|nr:hypothetical protein [Thermoleophilaceae bacterium]
MNVRFRARLCVFGAVLLAAATAAVLVALPAAATGTGGTRLDAKVVATNPGPLPACSDDCGPANTVHYFIYIENGNDLTNDGGATSRGLVTNAFVVDSISYAIFVDGVQDHDFDFTWTPPPNPSYPPYSGHWLVSASCPPEGPPCTAVGSPAVLPREVASVFYTGWAHGNTEPNGTYVFKFTIEGTLNGTPVTLTANSRPIVMTS